VRDTERERLTQIESKVAPIIAGTLAALGLFIDKAASGYDYIAGSLLLVPLGTLFAAFLTFDYDDVPNLDELGRTYEFYPKTFTKSVVLAAAEVVAKNAPRIDAKAKLLNRAMAVLFGSIVIVLAVRVGEAVHTAQTNAAREPKGSVTAHAFKTPSPPARKRAAEPLSGRSLRPRG
jgi:hypothetical protein